MTRTSWLVAGAFSVAGLVAVHANTFLNDEGVLTWIFGGIASESPLDALFFLKVRPTVSLLYAPVAVAGLTPFLWVHVLLAALAIPLTASLARDFGHDRPNFAAALVASSPMYFAGAAAGVQNTDGTVGLLLAVWLLSRQWPIAAAAALSFVVLARTEIAFFGVALAVYAALTPGCRRFLPSVAAMLTVYALAGAVYHGDLLWTLHYPSFPTSNPTIDPAMRARYGGDLKDLTTTILALLPVIGAVLWTSFRRCGRLEFTLWLTAIAFLLAIRILPFTQVIYVDDSPRYVLPALPFLCLAVGRAVEEWGRNWRRSIARGVLLLGSAGVVGLWMDPSGSRELAWFGSWAWALPLAAAGACVLAAALAFVSAQASAVTLVGAAVVAGWPLLPSTHLFLGDRARQLDAGLRWIAAAQVPRDAVVVTDLHLLRIWMEQYAPGLAVDVRHLITPDTLFDVKTSPNPATGQATLLYRTRFYYAPWISAEQIASLPGDTFFVMRTDSDRNRFLSAPPFDRVEWLVKGDRWMGGRLIHDAAARAAGTP
jgi:hypothetical protein